jgi:hypothetical protein
MFVVHCSIRNYYFSQSHLSPFPARPPSLGAQSHLLSEFTITLSISVTSLGLGGSVWGSTERALRV